MIQKIILIVACFAAASKIAASERDIFLENSQKSTDGRFIEIFPGIKLILDSDEIRIKFGPGKTTEDDVLESEDGREAEKSGLSKYAPMMSMIPFLIQMLSLPAALASIKMSLLKSLMVAKLAAGIMLFNAIRNSQRTEEVVVHQHYQKFYPSQHAEEDDEGWFGR